tara:strand:+ start:411 stop:728 length:318 start_codon:yes stop_codon:yes gene_type:complete
MVKRHDKGADGKYHIGNMKYDLLEGSRAQVMHGTAYKTSGGLKKHELMMKNGRILSKKKSHLAKTQKHLKGFLQPKGSGVFGIKKTKKSIKRTSKKRSKRSNRRK